MHLLLQTLFIVSAAAQSTFNASSTSSIAFTRSESRSFTKNDNISTTATEFTSTSSATSSSVSSTLTSSHAFTSTSLPFFRLESSAPATTNHTKSTAATTLPSSDATPSSSLFLKLEPSSIAAKPTSILDTKLITTTASTTSTTISSSTHSISAISSRTREEASPTIATISTATAMPKGSPKVAYAVFGVLGGLLAVGGLALFAISIRQQCARLVRSIRDLFSSKSVNEDVLPTHIASNYSTSSLGSCEKSEGDALDQRMQFNRVPYDGVRLHVPAPCSPQLSISSDPFAAVAKSR
ncbi:hypothetical protein SISNIDRAFT_448115, partial [Sistotremastrum niveocremeum HHB9708]